LLTMVQSYNIRIFHLSQHALILDGNQACFLVVPNESHTSHQGN
jgi:hypothetical protein